MNVLDFMATPDFMGTTFHGESWEPWRAVLSGAFGLPMEDDRLELFKRLSGGREAPSSRVRELWVVAGRRSAKTQTAAAVAVYLATIGAELEGLAAKLSPGERGVVAILAVDRQQAKVALGYIRGMVEDSPVLKRLVERETTDSFDLTNRVSIEVHTNSFRAIRGRTLLAVLMDEAAFFRSDTHASPDVETYRAAVPGLATTGGMLIGISSPYSRKGLLYSKYAKHYGENGEILVVKGGTADFNPTINPQVIEDALTDDPEGARAEWLGEFRSDIAAFVDRQTVEALARSAPLELLPIRGHRYFAFVDPAGGGRDEFCLAIGHMEHDVTVVDCLRAQRGKPADITAEYAQLLRTYGLKEVTGDRYGGTWPADEFKKHGIRFSYATKTRTELYQHCLGQINSGRLELPPDPVMLNQFATLERRTSRSGRDTIDHPVNAHDDRANVVAGLAFATRQPTQRARMARIRGLA
ncbi:hypothetical protein [Halomonas sp.]|uniref:hypothetical protein n=1 Tax=Halomonas sp. TaxID=1486246 RepID=UPI0026262E77|nr:hypothetical protein [Halomonas sp.]